MQEKRSPKYRKSVRLVGACPNIVLGETCLGAYPGVGAYPGYYGNYIKKTFISATTVTENGEDLRDHSSALVHTRSRHK